MDRFAAMLILLGLLVSAVLILLALFAVAPIMCSCVLSLCYSLYLFMAYEESGVHHAQEFENRFWTAFALLFATALFYASDSPLNFIGRSSPSLAFALVLISGYLMHLWDRYAHRIAISQQTKLRRATTANTSLIRLRDLGIPVEEQLARINECLKDIDQVFIPSTINNYLNHRFILKKEREIIDIFEECDARALNYLIGHVKLGLLFYKIKDHRNFNGKHRTELINLLAVERLPTLTIISRVIVLMKLRANPRAEFWVRNILLNTHGDDLSELKTLTDAKGDYFCMNKLIYDDIKSESVRQDILNHLRRDAAVKQTHIQMGTRRAKKGAPMQWRKVLSDVDDTLCCSGGMYPAGIDKQYPKKAIYPGVLAFYRELDLGILGPDEWHDDRVGNLVFLSARPHLYKDISEKANYAKFEKLRVRGEDGLRKGMHTTPSLLTGDLSSGGQYMFSNDFEPLARKKFDNFRRYVSIYPEYQHVFVCDNGQGDVRAGEMMFDGFPYEFEALYVHIVQDVSKTYGYAPERWRQKDFKPYFFRTYPEAALHAASRNPPLIRIKGLQRICKDAVDDFAEIKKWNDERQKALRRRDINQAVWRANFFLQWHCEEPVELIQAERRFDNGEKVRTPFGIGVVHGFDAEFDLYDIALDWRPLNVQVAEHLEEVKRGVVRRKNAQLTPRTSLATAHLATVVESGEEGEDENPSEDRKAKAPFSSLRPSAQSIGESSSERADMLRPLRSQSMPIRLPSEPPELLHEGEKSDDTSRSEGHEMFVRSPKRKLGDFPVYAKIHGSSISSYTPPVLPKLVEGSKHQRGASLFNFLAGAEAPKRIVFNAGDRVTTPYGPAKVTEHRQKDFVVVVEMLGWQATGYLREEIVKVAPKSLLGTLMRQLSMPDKEKQKPAEFPHAEGTPISTPFGPGKVSRPLPKAWGRTQNRSRPPTMGISLVSWKLANGSHPTIYCTEETARLWKERKEDSSSIFSTLGTLVKSSKRTLLEPFLTPKPTTPVSEPPKLFSRYYQDAAAVSTQYGNGVVRAFRPTDGFYRVSLTSWTLANGAHADAYLRKESISHRVASGCHEGYPVLTSLGLTGILASVEPTTGVHIVSIPSAGMVCYLQPECVVRSLKAAVGDDVLTAFGEGKVVDYNKRNDTYTIRLSGWGATLYARGDTFDRVGDHVQDSDGAFGVNWLLSFLFSSDKQRPARSRSNSIVSGSSRVSASSKSAQ